MAVGLEKVKIPGESASSPPPSGVVNQNPVAGKPSFASPQIQTAADVSTSNALAGNSATPKLAEVLKQPEKIQQNAARAASSLLGAGGQPAPSNPQAVAAKAPSGATTQKASGASSATTPAGNTGGTPAPSSPTTATVPTSTGAPPGVPATEAVLPPPTGGLTPTMKSTQGANASEADWIEAQNENQERLYEAAMKYNGGPDSALETARRAAEKALHGETQARGIAGTTESSLYNEGKAKIGETEAVADVTAYHTYMNEVRQYQDALNKAQIAWERANEQEKREMAESAKKTEPTEPINPPPGNTRIPGVEVKNPGGTAQPKTSNRPVKNISGKSIGKKKT